MARRGNSSKYTSGDNERWWQISDRKIPKRLLEEAWRRQRAVDPFVTGASRVAAAGLDDTVNGRDVETALGVLADVLGDEAFRTAQLALRAYGLNDGGIKQGLKQLVGPVTDPQSLIGPMCRIEGWTLSGFSVNAAAERVAAQLGTPGASFDAAVKSLRTAYAAWKGKKSVQPSTRPDGDTGRRFLVRQHGTSDLRSDSQYGVAFDAEGFGVVPDNNRWRWMIAQGYVALYGPAEVWNFLGR